jgi:hypothetical protein
MQILVDFTNNLKSIHAFIKKTFKKIMVQHAGLEHAQKGILPGACAERDLAWSMRRKGSCLEHAQKGILPGACAERDLAWSIRRKGSCLEHAQKGILPGACAERDLAWSMHRKGSCLSLILSCDERESPPPPPFKNPFISARGQFSDNLAN